MFEKDNDRKITETTFANGLSTVTDESVIKQCSHIEDFQIKLLKSEPEGKL